MSTRTLACHKCRFVWTYTPPLERRAECPECRSDARACLNCRHFDGQAHHQCREEQAEWVKEKDRGNFCSYFTPLAAAAGDDEAATAKAKLDHFFGGAKPAAAKSGASLADELSRFLGGRK